LDGTPSAVGATQASRAPCECVYRTYGA
jgi:hypothetical protein